MANCKKISLRLRNQQSANVFTMPTENCGNQFSTLMQADRDTHCFFAEPNNHPRNLSFSPLDSSCKRCCHLCCTMSQDSQGYYEVLGLHYEATQAEIKSAYRKCALVPPFSSALCFDLSPSSRCYCVLFLSTLICSFEDCTSTHDPHFPNASLRLCPSSVSDP